MKLVVLISCMYQNDTSIIERSNVQTDAVIVNQCDKDEILCFDFKNKNGENCHVKFISTKERGLSRSRNMAISNACGDICYICDDDELLEDNYEDIITKAYSSRPSCDILTFALHRKNYIYPKKEKKVGIKDILKTSSVQITFKRDSIIRNNIMFDMQMGSGTGHGGGEENKFLMDCRRKGMGIYYIPEIIATVKSEDSQWFHGFTEKYFKDTFWAARRSLGSPLALVYIFYWCLYRSKYFKIEMSKIKMIKYSFMGFFEKR